MGGGIGLSRLPQDRLLEIELLEIELDVSARSIITTRDVSAAACAARTSFIE